MNGQLILHLVSFGLINLAIILVGYLFIKHKMILTGWLTLVISILIVHLLFIHEHPILRMFAIIATTFTGMKVIAVTEGYRNKPLTLSFKQWIVYAVGWVGMRAEPFETLGGKPLPNAWPMVKFGISRVIIGGLLIVSSHVIVNLHLHQNLTYVLVSAMLLIGFSLVLHFGMLASARACGVSRV